MLGDNTLFSWKNKATQEREQAEYEKWAFPYGEKQRENLTALLLKAFPKETVPTTLVPFLTCRELYENMLKKLGSRNAAVDNLLNVQKKYKRILTKKTMPKFLAFVLADADLKEGCEYPSLETILEMTADIESRKIGKK